MSTIPHSVAARSPRLHLAARIVAAILGGYGFAWGIVAAGASLMFAAGMDFHDAEFLASLFGVLAFLAVFLWTFAANSMVKVWVVFAGGAAVMTGAALAIQQLLVG